MPKKRRCDKVVDCFLGDDEMNCWTSSDLSANEREIVGSQGNLFDHLLQIANFDRSSEEYNNDVSTENLRENKEKHISETDDISFKMFQCAL